MKRARLQNILRQKLTLRRSVILAGGLVLTSSMLIFGANMSRTPEHSGTSEPVPTVTVTQVSEKPVPGPTVTEKAPAPKAKPEVACAEYVTLVNDLRAAVLEYEHHLGKMAREYDSGITQLGARDIQGATKHLGELQELDSESAESALKIAELDDQAQKAAASCKRILDGR